jgi:hypothetical protein
MKYRIIHTVLLVFLTGFAISAQSPHSAAPVEDIYHGLVCCRAMPDPADRPIAAPSEARQKEHEFWLRTDKFVKLWTSLAREYNEKGTFNMKTAKQISKAFHDLEHTEGWPKAVRP